MSEDLECEDDVFLEEGVLYCTCGHPIEAEDVAPLIAKLAGKEFVACPTCEMRHFADSGRFRLDE